MLFARCAWGDDRRDRDGSIRAFSLLSIAAAFGAAAVRAQSPTGEAPGTAPQTPWGDPDLQGIWVGSTLTPLERPPQFEGRGLPYGRGSRRAGKPP